MIAYMPTIYPDELVYSWFCRYYVHSGCFSHKTALQELYCKKSDYLSKEFIGNLNNEAMEQIDEIYSLDKLVLDHTMYSQYARFIPLAEKKEALYRLGHDSCDVHYLFPVLPRNDGERYLRYCPLCVKRDRETYGEAYWHRKHQIRNMCICSQHKCRLLESSVPAKSEQSFTFCPAENYTYEGKAVFETDLSVIQYMKYLVSVFDSVMDFENDIPISSILYDGMSRTKYLKPSGRSRYTKMLTDEIAPVLERFAKGVYDGTASETGRPERVSEKLVYREMGLLGHQLENMPRCKVIFEKYTESYPESWARKIIWAYRKLEEEGKPFYWTDIRRISGVKRKNLPEAVPYLKEHANADMVERIKKLIVS